MRRRSWLLAVLTLWAILLLSKLTIAQQPRIPPDAHGYERMLLQQQSLPWDHQRYRGYKEAPRSSPSPASVTRSPSKYTLSVTVLPQRHKADDPNAALVVAHVPEDASVWFDDEPTRQRGTMRLFQSESLKPDHEYNYKVRVVWFEDGQWVSQMTVLPVKAGGIHCLDVIPSDAETVEKEVKGNLAKLGPDDRKLAEGQQFCAVQEGIRLGAMGVPVKVMIKGEPAFLCCAACEASAQKNPDQTLNKVKKLKSKNPATP